MLIELSTKRPRNRANIYNANLSMLLLNSLRDVVLPGIKYSVKLPTNCPSDVVRNIFRVVGYE